MDRLGLNAVYGTRRGNAIGQYAKLLRVISHGWHWYRASLDQTHSAKGDSHHKVEQIINLMLMFHLER